MQRIPLPPRILAALLSLLLAVPDSALALRTEQREHQSGLEEIRRALEDGYPDRLLERAGTALGLPSRSATPTTAPLTSISPRSAAGLEEGAVRQEMTRGVSTDIHEFLSERPTIEELQFDSKPYWGLVRGEGNNWGLHLHAQGYRQGRPGFVAMLNLDADGRYAGLGDLLAEPGLRLDSAPNELAFVSLDEQTFGPDAQVVRALVEKFIQFRADDLNRALDDIRAGRKPGGYREQGFMHDILARSVTPGEKNLYALVDPNDFDAEGKVEITHSAGSSTVNVTYHRMDQPAPAAGLEEGVDISTWDYSKLPTELRGGEPAVPIPDEGLLIKPEVRDVLGHHFLGGRESIKLPFWVGKRKVGESDSWQHLMLWITPGSFEVEEGDSRKPKSFEYPPSFASLLKIGIGRNPSHPGNPDDKRFPPENSVVVYKNDNRVSRLQLEVHLSPNRTVTIYNRSEHGTYLQIDTIKAIQAAAKKLSSGSPTKPPTAGLEEDASEVPELLSRWLNELPSSAFFQTPGDGIPSPISDLRRTTHLSRADQMRARLVEGGQETLKAILHVLQGVSSSSLGVRENLAAMKAKVLRGEDQKARPLVSPHPFDETVAFGPGWKDPSHAGLIKLVEDISRAHSNNWKVLTLAYQVMLKLYGMEDRIKLFQPDENGLRELIKFIDGEAKRFPPMVRGILWTMYGALSTRLLGTVKISLSPNEQTKLLLLIKKIKDQTGYDPLRPDPNHPLFTEIERRPFGHQKDLMESRDLGIGLDLNRVEALDGSVRWEYDIYAAVRNGRWDPVRLRVIKAWTEEMERDWETKSDGMDPLLRPNGVGIVEYPIVGVQGLSAVTGENAQFLSTAKLDVDTEITRAPRQLNLAFSKDLTIQDAQARLPAILTVLVYIAPEAVSEQGLQSNPAGLEEGMRHAVDFLTRQNIREILPLLGGPGSVTNLKGSFSGVEEIQALASQGIEPLLFSGPVSVPAAHPNFSPLKLMVEPQYKAGMEERLRGIPGLEFVDDPAQARFVIGDRGFVERFRSLASQAVFLQVNPGTVGILTKDFMMLMTSQWDKLRPGEVLVVGMQAGSDQTVLFRYL